MSTMTLKQARSQIAAVATDDDYMLQGWIAAIDAHITQPAQAVDVQNLSDALRLLEEYAAAGVTLGTDDAARLRANTRALSGEKAGPVDGWQPIETAPKDQTVLVYPPLWSGRTCSIARYNDDKYCKKPAPYWHRDDDLGQKTRSRGVPPTHWMPIPASPTPDKEE